MRIFVPVPCCKHPPVTTTPKYDIAATGGDVTSSSTAPDERWQRIYDFGIVSERLLYVEQLQSLRGERGISERQRVTIEAMLSEYDERTKVSAQFKYCSTVVVEVFNGALVPAVEKDGVSVRCAVGKIFIDKNSQMKLGRGSSISKVVSGSIEQHFSWGEEI
jgi:hypothetical protein